MAEPRRPRVLLLGPAGQVGWELVRTLAPLGDVRCLDRAAIDLSDLSAVRTAAGSSGADVIVNAAAYTQVDRAETERELAMCVNGDAPGVLAAEAARLGALFVHYSTDYVFDGLASRAYVETDAPSPRTAYGASKLRGDEAVLASGADAYVFRVGWVYGARGHNFLRTMQRLARERTELRVVADQHGAPTWSRAIAEATALAAGAWLSARREGRAAPPRGVYHMASPDYASWHAFASAIVEHTPMPEGKARPIVTPITTADYPTPAPRPAWSVLDSTRLRANFGLELAGWREQLRDCLS